MIETCSKRCMLLGTVGLGVLTIVVLILESHLAETLSGSQRMKNKTFPTENNSTCWLHQPYKIISECHPCSGKHIMLKDVSPRWIWTLSFKDVMAVVLCKIPASLSNIRLGSRPWIIKENTRKIDFEIRSKSIGVCIHTSFKEILKCDNGETVTRSCDRVAYLEERAYWKFTIWSFVIGAISSIAVMLRMRVLNHRAKRRARQVLSNGSI